MIAPRGDSFPTAKDEVTKRCPVVVSETGKESFETLQEPLKLPC